jgi:hypothetical protein
VGCGAAEPRPVSTIGKRVPLGTCTMNLMDSEWGPDGEPLDPESFGGEAAAQPSPLRSWLTARVRPPGQLTPWRMPRWLGMALPFIGIVIGLIIRWVH